MVFDEYINVNDDRLMNGLIPVVRIMQRAAVSGEEALRIDFSHTKFISPVFALSLIVFLSKSGRKYSFANLNEYLSIIGLSSGGIRPDRMRKRIFRMRRTGVMVSIPQRRCLRKDWADSIFCCQEAAFI